MTLSQEKLAHFQSIGPARVLLEMAEGKHGQAPDSRSWIEASTWVESDKQRVSIELDAKRDAREERMLSITSSALEIAKESAAASARAALAAERQARWALCAAIIATTAIIVDADEIIKEFITYLNSLLI